MGASKCWKIVDFPNISNKMNNFKTFYEGQVASSLKEIIQPPTRWKCKYFFWHQQEAIFLENFYNEFGFWLCFGSIFFEILSEFIFVKWVRFFGWNCIVKWVIFLARFCWLWDFLLENLKLIGKLQIWGFETFIFWPKLFFGTVSGHFSQCNLKIFRCQPTMMADIFIQPPHHKKVSCSPVSLYS